MVQRQKLKSEIGELGNLKMSLLTELESPFGPGSIKMPRLRRFPQHNTVEIRSGLRSLPPRK